ncbi:hypothetical protein AURDEDRAFT_162451 [Auricularia subglabra TFB-10046 SS5]|nr:hypothetical protein AURDEDRAFT_162451 [Auricularia subglabra TFB-10046 SS5]
MPTQQALEFELRRPINGAYFSRPTPDDLGALECFSHRQSCTTIEVKCPQYMRVAYGGLFLQVALHFLPHAPTVVQASRSSTFAKSYAREQGPEVRRRRRISALSVLANMLGDVTLARGVAQSEVDELAALG